jgi:predicted NAD/FAD-dependent oxidoreductase
VCSSDLSDKSGNALGTFDFVISTAPPMQTLALFNTALPQHSPLQGVRMQGCYTLMIGFHQPWDKSWIAAKVKDSPIEWIAINSTKPDRNKAVTTIVAHSRNDWADAHIDDDMNEAHQFLLAEFERISGIDCHRADYIAAHRWKYAIVEEPEKPGFYLDLEHNIAATGDWACASRIEEVWLNAMKLAKKIVSSTLYTRFG